MALSDRVREAIDGSEKSQAEIARACKVTDAAITHLLKGRTNSLRAETAVAMETATGYRARWLLYGTGPKKLDAASRLLGQGDLYERVSKLKPEEMVKLENVIRAHLGEPVPPSPPVDVGQVLSAHAAPGGSPKKSPSKQKA